MAQQWAQVSIPVAHLRSKPGNSHELSSQELMGMPVRLMRPDGGWWLIETPDGYTGWMRGESLAMKSDGDMQAWRGAERLVVTSHVQITCYDAPAADSPRSVVTDLVPMSIVEGSLSDTVAGRVEVTLPDGRKAWANASAFTAIEEWASQPFDAGKVLDQAYALIGTPYLWGGASVKALDCSGLSKICYLANGIFLRRDASMQARTGKQLPKDDWRQLRQGDLIFFGSKSTGKVTHVAIYDADGKYVHSTGTGDRVRINSADPSDAAYLPLTCLGAVRIQGMENTDGIVKASAHAWLFNL